MSGTRSSRGRGQAIQKTVFRTSAVWSYHRATLACIWSAASIAGRATHTVWSITTFAVDDVAGQCAADITRPSWDSYSTKDQTRCFSTSYNHSRVDRMMITLFRAASNPVCKPTMHLFKKHVNHDGSRLLNWVDPVQGLEVFVGGEAVLNFPVLCEERISVSLATRIKGKLVEAYVQHVDARLLCSHVQCVMMLRLPSGREKRRQKGRVLALIKRSHVVERTSP